MFCPSIIAKTRNIVHMLFALKAGDVFVFILEKNNQVLNWNSAGVGKPRISYTGSLWGKESKLSIFTLIFMV